MTSDLVKISKHGGVATIALNDPRRRNMLSAKMIDAIDGAFEAVEADPSVRCVVLTGEGESFCAGADMASLRAASEGNFEAVESVYGGFLRVLRSPLATIAAVNGPAVGAGFNLALACDVRLAGRNALFDTRFAQLHIHPGGGHAWLLARAVGQQRATLAALFGEKWTAADALDAGLVAAVYGDDLTDSAVALGRRLDGQDPTFVRRLTSTIRNALTTVDHAEALDHEAREQRWSTTQEAFKLGVRAIEEQISQRRNVSGDPVPATK